jgi:hypothetical protein
MNHGHYGSKEKYFHQMLKETCTTLSMTRKQQIPGDCHVYNVFLHGPMRVKCASALKKTLDFMVHVQKFGRFLYNSETTPKLRIPDIKVLRALALLGFLMRGSITLLGRLALEVVVGTLQYLVPATPNAIGASFVHHVYQNIHNETLENFDNIQDFYHSGLNLGALAEADFHWWGKTLKSGLC